MENNKVTTKDHVAALVRTVKFACAVAELDDPSCKQAVLDALIGELEEMAGRKKVCVGEGTCRNDEPTKDCGEPQNLDFGQAIRLLKEGKRLARREWGEGETVIMVKNPTYGKGDPQDANDIRLLPKVLALESKTILMGWHPPRRDMLAEDWYVVK